MNARIWLCLILAAALATGCANPPSKESALVSRQDSPAAVRIKAALLETSELAGSAIDVTVENDKIVLTGFVETPEQKARAEAVALEQGESANLESLENRIIVK